jgi:steroid delta-isomerase-like uncharacterized protein
MKRPAPGESRSNVAYGRPLNAKSFDVRVVSAWAEQPQYSTRGGDMTAEDYKAIDRQYFEEVWTEGNAAAVDRFYAPTFVCHHPPRADIRGRDGIRKQVERTHGAYADVRYTLDDQIAEGNETLTRWTMRGTPRKPITGVAPSGLPVVITGLTLMRYNADGQMQEEWTYWAEHQRLGS